MMHRLHLTSVVIVTCCLLQGSGTAAASDNTGPYGRRLLTYTWNPPKPPLPSYPCKTKLPTIRSSFTKLYVDPAAADGGDGSQARPFNTFADAWRQIPTYRKLSRGVAISVYPGISGAGADSFWMEGVWGTKAAPVIIQKAPGTSGDSDIQSINVWNCTYLYFSGIKFIQPAGSDGGGDVVHFAYCDYIHLLGVTITGQTGDSMPHETLKVNQVKGMYIEDSDISHADDNAIDFVAVQYGHICRSMVQYGNWCLYVKGGSSYILIDSNTVTHCGESGLSVGQGTGFEYMIQPWINYEAYGVTVTNNVITDVWGAGLGVEGGYDVLMAYNSLYSVGSRSHAVEFLFGSRSCDGDTSDMTSGRCDLYNSKGGWGPGSGGNPVAIPNKNVYFMNNLVINPADSPTQWTHFSAPADVPGDLDPPLGVAHPSVADNLRIQGNVFINRRIDGNPMELGLDACVNSNPACNIQQVNGDNSLNPDGLEVAFANTNTLVLDAASKAALRAVWKPASIPNFPAWSTPIKTPPGTLRNVVMYSWNGQLILRNGGGSDLPGAQL